MSVRGGDINAVMKYGRERSISKRCYDLSVGGSGFGRILLLVVLLVVYGTLYPFDFHVRQPGPAPLWILFHSWPGPVNRFVMRDSTLNILIYLPVGLFGSLWMRQYRSPAVSTWLIISFAAVLSAALEVTQLFDDSR